jgi:ketosteroid isomerase-like protein
MDAPPCEDPIDMKKLSRILFALVLGALPATGFASPAAAAGGDPAIAALLTQSAAYWNGGKLDAFMRSYEDSPDTVYVSSKSVIHGYANIRAHYASHYGKSGMGALSFSDLAVRPLGPAYAVVVARWHLALANGAHPSGIFTLVLHRSSAGWHIITDHSP